ncbi:hypothetical protein DQK91_07620 [Oceanidesulfovibrio marinus]|uniref:Sulfotransferase n=1 Tax=Oceanidesulfovibrio marinus TaxID=370038 RepID=A0A6P1ZIQ5_9BACT|nr:hypothetical protein DQK91_07620 [Oceanidesulfovibrio marinus]
MRHAHDCGRADVPCGPGFRAGDHAALRELCACGRGGAGRDRKRGTGEGCRGVPGVKKPNLFLVGEQKAGTTTLHQMLSAHPDVFMTPLKEPGFFCTDLHSESDSHHKKRKFYSYRSWEEYIKLYSNWGSEQYGGESSSLYFFSKEAIRNIHYCNPESKIIILLRDPLTYIPSLHAQYLKEQNEDISDLNAALNAEPKRRQGLLIPTRVPAPSLLYYSKRVQYGRHLERVYKYFDKKNVYVEFFDNLISNNSSSFAKILHFLNVSQHVTIRNIQANPRKKRRFNILYTLINNPQLKWIILRSSPLDLQLKIKRLLDAIFLGPGKRPSLTEDLRCRLIEMSRAEVLHLEQVLGRPTPWKWVHED